MLKYCGRWFSKVYTDLDEMPLHNWTKVQAGDLRYIYKFRTFMVTESANEAYEKLYDQFIERFGLPDEYIDMLDRMKEHALAIADYIANPNEPINHTRKEIARIEMESFMSGAKSEPVNSGEYIAAVEKHYGIAIDVHNTTVQQFFARVGLMKKEIKAHEQVIK